MTQTDPLARLKAAQGLDDLTELVSRAAASILAFDRSRPAWRAKSDHSPISAADEASDAIIVQGVAHLMPGLPIVSEEAQERPSTLAPAFVLVDPLDGTREFLAGRDEFTVNIAVISQGRRMVGVIAAPALGLVWRGVVGQGAERLGLAAGAAPDHASGRWAIRARRRPAAGFVAMISRSRFDEETDALLRRLPLVARNPCGSSLKFTRIAEGSADLYARLARTCEWDVAAGHAILAAAGGIVTTPDGSELVYGHGPDFHVPGFIAWGDPSSSDTGAARPQARSAR